MNENAQALGRLGGRRGRGIPKSPEHKAKLLIALTKANAVRWIERDRVRKLIVSSRSKASSKTPAFPQAQEASILPHCQYCIRTDVKELWLAGNVMLRCPDHVAG